MIFPFYEPSNTYSSSLSSAPKKLGILSQVQAQAPKLVVKDEVMKVQPDILNEMLKDIFATLEIMSENIDMKEQDNPETDDPSAYRRH
jgi:hypothetical protein